MLMPNIFNYAPVGRCKASTKYPRHKFIALKNHVLPPSPPNSQMGDHTDTKKSFYTNFLPIYNSSCSSATAVLTASVASLALDVTVSLTSAAALLTDSVAAAACSAIDSTIGFCASSVSSS